MSLIKWNQPSPLTGRRNWIENFFNETDDFFKNWDWDRSNNVPAMNVREEKDAFLIEMAAPGMKKEDFQVEMENGVLMISASTEEKKEEKDRRVQAAGIQLQEF
jgi:HSP20 family protein